MASCKRLAMLSAQSAISVAKSRGLGSSYRRISELIAKDSNLSKNSQENHSTVVQREMEKLRRDMEKMRIELRVEIEQSRNKLSKLSEELHGFGAELEATKYDFFKYGLGILVSTTAVGISVLCSMMK